MSNRPENQLQKEIQRLQNEDQGIDELIKSLSNEVLKLQRDELAIRAAILKRDRERNMNQTSDVNEPMF